MNDLSRDGSFVRIFILNYFLEIKKLYNFPSLDTSNKLKQTYDENCNILSHESENTFPTHIPHTLYSYDN